MGMVGHFATLYRSQVKETMMPVGDDGQEKNGVAKASCLSSLGTRIIHTPHEYTVTGTYTF